MTFPDGTAETLTVAAIYPDQRILGDIVIDRSTYAARTPRRRPTARCS